MCVRLCNASNHASFWRLVIFHGKTAKESMGFVCVLESVGHLTADNTLEKFLRWKIALKLDILHSHYGYNIMAYYEMTSYQWHDVTERPPTAIGETVTVIPISYACTAIFGLIPHLNIVSNGWRIYSSTSEGPNRPVNINTRQGNWLLTQRKASPRPHFMEHPQEYGFCTWLCGTHGGAVWQRR